MTKRTIRGGRWVTAWAVAYVLVLQAFLTGVALAAMPVNGSDLCLASAAVGDTAQHPETGSTGQVHCQACLARADVPALPPPAPDVVIDRIAIELTYQATVRVALRTFDHHTPFQPRGPPASRPA